MAKITGIGANFWIDKYNVSGDIGAVDSINSSRTQIDVTGIDKDFMERLPGIGDGSMTFTGYFNPSAGGFHQAFGSAFGTAITICTLGLGTAIGSPAASIGGARASYNPTRGADGSLVVQASAESGIGYGLDWGVLLNASASATGTASTTVDTTAASSAGAQAYLHITAVAAGTPVVIVEDSADNSSFTAVTGLTFTASSTAVSAYLATAGTAAVRRYLRYNVTGGTATFALNVAKN